MDVRPGEAVDRLPVVADGKHLGIGMLALECLDQLRPPGRDVLELIDEDVPKRTLVAPAFDERRGTVHHVLEVDPVAQAGLILLEDGAEYLEEGFGPLAHLQSLRLVGTVLDPVAAILEVTQEGAHQRGEAVHHPDLGDAIVDLDIRDRPQRDVGFELLGKRFEQSTLFALPAVGFDQHRLVLGMDLPFPVHACEVFLTIDVRGRRQLLLAVPAAFLAHAEMLDVDATLGQPEIGRVDAAPGLVELVLVARLVFVGDAVPEEPVGDQ